ncbi:Uncharacterized protein Fot_09650 [Forsythia ovata]|uniref:Uncharacterized protein n=1 Tax=Forsythia ovata TaxID=205694 RepID=A0ABD1WIC7_9LAMI
MTPFLDSVQDPSKNVGSSSTLHGHRFWVYVGSTSAIDIVQRMLLSLGSTTEHMSRWNLSPPVDRSLMQVLDDSTGLVIKVIHKSINGLDDSLGLVIKDNQLQVLDEIRITVEESHLFYLKAVRKDGPTDKWKYDIIFMIEPSVTTENIQEVNHLEHLSFTSLISVPYPLPPPTKRILFEVPSTSISNKGLTEDNHHGTAGNSILALSNSAAQATKSKEKGLATA